MPAHTDIPWPLLLADVLVICVAVVAAGSVLYHLVLLGAAMAVSRRRSRERRTLRRRSLPWLTIVVPAHDEAAAIAACLNALQEQRYPARRREIVVIADNCHDDTADRARRLGVRVLVREDTTRRGKGYALAWAFERLLAEGADGFVVVDADTIADPLFLRWMAEALFPPQTRHARSGVESEPLVVVQGRYSVRNAGEAWMAALAAGAFELTNHVKPLGRDTLGVSVGLKGNGMGFTRAVIERAPSVCSSITEDREYGLDLLEKHGIRVRYAPEARVRSAMPTTRNGAAAQRERWERGRYRLIRERAWPLLRDGLLRRDARRIEAALDLLTPPLAELAGLHLALGLILALMAAAGLRPPGGLVPWAAGVTLSTAGLGVYALAGLRLSRAPRAVYAALGRAPLYAAWKLLLIAISFIGRGSVGGRSGGALEWVRTQRS